MKLALLLLMIALLGAGISGIVLNKTNLLETQKKAAYSQGANKAASVANEQNYTPIFSIFGLTDPFGDGVTIPLAILKTNKIKGVFATYGIVTDANDKRFTVYVSGDPIGAIKTEDKNHLIAVPLPETEVFEKKGPRHSDEAVKLKAYSSPQVGQLVLISWNSYDDMTKGVYLKSMYLYPHIYTNLSELK